MNKVLENIKVLVTRPERQADKLCELIEHHGGTAIRLPVLEITESDNQQLAKYVLNDLEKYDIGIFISRNAVEWSLRLLDSDISALENLSLFSIGSATTTALQHVLSNDIITNNGTNSEALLENEALRATAIKGKKIIIFRGHGGRELLATKLRQRGAQVDYVEVYGRQRPEYDRDIIHKIWTLSIPDVVIVTSNMGLENLFSLLTKEQARLLLNKQLVVMGERMLDFSAKFAFTNTPIFTEENGDEGILDTIIRWAESRQAGETSK